MILSSGTLLLLQKLCLLKSEADNSFPTMQKKSGNPCVTNMIFNKSKDIFIPSIIDLPPCILLIVFFLMNEPIEIRIPEFIRNGLILWIIIAIAVISGVITSTYTVQAESQG